MARDGELAVRIFETPWGRVGVAAGPRGIVRLVLPGLRLRPSPATVKKTPGVFFTNKSAFLAPQTPLFAGKRHQVSFFAARRLAIRAEREVGQYLAGRRRRFTVPVDLSGVPAFQRRVLQALRRVPYGRTITYGQLAARAGRPRAARAVGQAMAHNPVPLIVPCHRVVASGGGLGGFGGGLALKRRLLALEA
jgi:O-6-methylguanine DNA methyltransferase